MTPSRREVLSASLALGGAGAIGASSGTSALAAPAPSIRPRSDWAGALAPKGPLESEAAGDVKFLLVHHSETGNGYGPDRSASILRGMYEFHTGPEKKWPDLAYNFLVDAHGTIWEGRSGSLTGPVKGSATGGSQGFAQLCCFIGTYTSTPPSAAAQSAMSSLLAWLAQRYGVNLHAGRTITFVSRGSNRWPAGTRVTTDPVAGHRDMSQTTCPGDACYPLVRGALLSGAQALVPVAAQPAAPAPSQPAPSQPAPSQPAPSQPAPSQPAPSPTDPAPTTAQPDPSASDAAREAAPSSVDSSASAPVRSSSAATPGSPGDGAGVPAVAGAIGAAAALAAGGVAMALSRRRGDDVPDLDAHPSRLDD